MKYGMVIHTQSPHRHTRWDVSNDEGPFRVLAMMFTDNALRVLYYQRITSLPDVQKTTIYEARWHYHHVHSPH